MIRFTTRKILPLTGLLSLWSACLLFLWPACLYAAPIVQISLPEQQVAMPDKTMDISELNPSDVDIYKRIFRLQSHGKWKKADRLIKKLDNKILLGHILYQRYMHPTAYSSHYKELASWMLHYPDQPGAKRIYNLAKKKNGGKVGNLHKPMPSLALHFPGDKPKRNHVSPKEKIVSEVEDNIDPTVSRPQARHKKEDRVDISALKSRIKRYLRRNAPERAEKRLWAFERRHLLTKIEFNKLLGNIAAGYFFDNQDAKAFAIGAIAAENSREAASGADWITGLAAWRLGDCEQAAYYFDNVAHSPVAGDWAASAGAFWAARAYLVCRQPEKVSAALHKAALFQRTFYGLIAARLLGQNPVLNWTAPAFTEDQYNRIKGLKNVRRAIALSQTNKITLADMEMSAIWRRTKGTYHEALLGLSAKLGLAATQLKIGKIEEQKRRTALDSTLYPIPNTIPDGGFTLDKALIFAIMRQESEFNSWAKSHAGARGLMQVMPRTASYISRDRSLRYGSRIKLDNPLYNMALGQQYIQSMLGKDFANGNLFKTLTAYNAGPGNLRKWERKINFQDDPLLFIESLPARETRNYIERVVSNFWIYRMQMRQPTTSLDTIAIGAWPMYLSQDHNKKKRQKHAARY